MLNANHSHEVVLENGVTLPLVGLGVYKIEEDTMHNALKAALEAGYRCFDTAQLYQNEDALGKELKNIGIAREEVFITSKVANSNQGYASTMESFDESLRKLQTDYLDMFMVHWAGQNQERYLATWRALEDLYLSGKVRVIGVCNFTIGQLEILLQHARIKPMVNQIERNPLWNEKELIAFCKQHHIQIQAWAPLSRGNFYQPSIVEIAKKYKKTPAQILLRWNVQDAICVIPKSTHRERIFENIDIFDFILEPEDMEVLSNMHAGKRTSHDPETHDF
ncbi:MAG: aldo/keto reductase [Erysipelotrichaceae bacterium]|nr:aldo/keto reductase [Erysipelotrichaceae bacterium]